MAECQLTERIAIKKIIGKEKDQEGNIVPIYEDYYSCWCRYRAVNSKTLSGRDALHYQNIDSFLVRFCNKTKVLLEENKESFIIIYKNRSYKILYPYDIKNQHNFIELECEVVE